MSKKRYIVELLIGFGLLALVGIGAGKIFGFMPWTWFYFGMIFQAAIAALCNIKYNL